jgi:hypothetical protein
VIVFYFLILFAGRLYEEPVVSGAFFDHAACDRARAHAEAELATTSECYGVAK